MTQPDFTLGSYQSLIEALHARGYAAVGYGAVDPIARHLLLRHDLDMSIEAALPVAEIEAALGAKGHYFVLLRTEMYNPWSAAARDGLHRIAALGHEVGLHFDASFYPDDAKALDNAAAAECASLESIVGRPVETISFHRPASRLLGRAEPIAGRRHAYQPRFFHEMGYCSDSRGAWHHGHPLDHPAVARGHALQLLTHPIWWSRSIPIDPVSALDEFRLARDGVLGAALSANCEPYRVARGDAPPPLQRKAD